MNVLGEVIGDLCKAILPIPEESYLGNPDSTIAVCTLSSIDLLKKFKNSLGEPISVTNGIRLWAQRKATSLDPWVSQSLAFYEGLVVRRAGHGYA